MINSFIKPARAPRAALALTGIAAVVATAFAPSGAALSAAASDCPDAVPTSELARGQAVTGLTVSEGTTPDQLTGEVIGVIDDGIAQGLDMVMVKLSGSDITDPDTGEVDAGIWQGMSGSPIYAEDGRLIGAVSYGLSYSPSDVAGVTPAGDMYAIQDYAAGPVSMKSKVDIPSAITTSLVSSGDVSKAQANRASMKRLAMPVGVSGFTNMHRLQRVAKLTHFGGHQFYQGMNASSDEAQIPIAPGGNLAASLAYGDTTYAGIGTATAVCGTNVLAFGHPFNWSGPSTMAMHGANALYVQRDRTFPSFKVANPAAPSGTITQDRLAGILGVQGQMPEGADITAHFTSSEGGDRTASTVATLQEAIEFIAISHALATADRTYDGIRGGSGNVRWTITVEDQDGKSYRLADEDRYNSGYDLTYSVINGLAEDLYRLSSQRFRQVHVTAVTINGSLDTVQRAYKVAKAEVRVGGKWINLNSRDLRVNDGRRLPVRVTMVPTSGGGERVVKTTRLFVPDVDRRKFAYLVVTGGDSYYERYRASSLPELITAIEQGVDNDQVVVELHVGRSTQFKRLQAPAVISGRNLAGFVVR